MAEQSGERPVTAELISLMVPDMDLELVQFVLTRVARSAVGGHVDHQGSRGKPQAAPPQEYAELLAFIRAAGIDRTQLRAILGLNPEALPAGDDNSHPPVQ